MRACRCNVHMMLYLYDPIPCYDDGRRTDANAYRAAATITYLYTYT